MSTRLMTVLSDVDGWPEARHFRGLPPEETGDQDHRERLAWPRVLVIEAKADGVFLFRFARDGSCVGDTWHLTVDDAKQQASDEYGPALRPWVEVPSEAADAAAFALAQVL